jgi:hypothetical protein
MLLYSMFIQNNPLNKDFTDELNICGTINISYKFKMSQEKIQYSLAIAQEFTQ